MNEPPPSPGQPVDDLVRAYLHGKAQQTDPKAGLQRIRATLGPKVDVRPSRSRRGWLTAAAAVLLVSIVGGLYISTASASEKVLVQQALQNHSQSVDRCYLVDINRDAEFLERHPFWAASRQSKLWTRGDRFWIESAAAVRPWGWGRDKENRLWIALSPRRGIRYESGEAPESLALLCDVLSMKVETLLGEILADFDLHKEPAEPGSYLIRAELKPGRTHPNLRSAVLEIDAETKVLKRVVLSRSFRGRATSTTTFFLINSKALDESRYQLEGHLSDPHQIFSRTFEPERRRQLLFGRFGKAALDPPSEP